MKNLIVWLSLVTGFNSFASVEPQTKPIVFTLTAKKQPLFDTLSYPARIVPKINAAILSETEGVITKVLAPLGQAVAKGQGIFIIRNNDPVYEFAPFTVRATVKGVVSAVEVTEGTFVSRGTRLGAVTDPSQVRAIIEIAVSDLQSVKVGMTGELKSPGSNETLLVKAVGVSPFIDPASGTASAELLLVDSQKKTLPPGLIGTVTFKVHERQGFDVPEGSVVYRGKDAFLRVVKEGKTAFSPVKTGFVRKGNIEILSGIEEGNEIIVRSSSFLADGDEVTVQKTEVGG